jgi:hypothetical protein
LLRTGSVEITSNKILERGYLDVVCKYLIDINLMHSNILSYSLLQHISLFILAQKLPHKLGKLLLKGKRQV